MRMHLAVILQCFTVRRDNTQLGILSNARTLLYGDCFWCVGRGMSRTKMKEGLMLLSVCLP